MTGAPGRDRKSRRGPDSSSALRFLSTYGLLLLLIGLFAFFSILLPQTFPTEFNVRSMLSDKSIIALLALAEMVPVATGSFDLSIGWGIGLYHILTVGLIRQDVPWPLVVAVVLGIGFIVGTINGLLVTRAGIDPFIASLGVGTFLFGVSLWYAPQQIVATMPPDLRALVGTQLGIPLPFVYVVIVAAGLWIMFERLPLGRFLYMLGANQRAAELTGISPKRHITFAFQVSGVITAFAGIVLGVRLGVAQTAIGLDYLLPAFVAVLLGSTTIRPGRVNVLGTLVAVFVIAVAVAGLQQLGAQFYVEPMFNGIMLVASVGLAAYAARRRARIRAAADASALG
jgi:ribose transport system permease protein